MCDSIQVPGSLKLILFPSYNTSPELISKYKDKIVFHNKSIRTNNYPDAGFDLLMPTDFIIEGNTTENIDLCIKGAMYICGHGGTNTPVSFQMLPRSSMGSKTNLRLGNSIGIIDSGYRGSFGAVLDNIREGPHNGLKYDRLLQICSGTLMPFYVYWSDVHSDMETERGEGGFGSSGQ